jgi:ParB family chromosome partitioning protein
MNPKNVLGRGLDALIGAPGPEAKRVLEVEIHRLKPNPRQPRAAFDSEALDELARSIAENGILQPILVRPADGAYEIIAGERRWRAAQQAGLHRVPVLVREAADLQMLELALVENLQRSDLNPVEEAKAYRLLVEDLGLTQEEVARKVGKDRATVANVLRLLHLPEPALRALEEGRITVGHAKAILSRRRREEQAALLEAVLRRGLSVREAEAFRLPAKAAGPERRTDPDTAAAEKTLSRHLGLPVSIRRRGKGGRLEVAFRNEEELQGLYERLLGERRRTP